MLLAKAKSIEEGEEETVVLVKSLQTRDEQLQQDFRREAEMFSKLSHANVVRLLGLCREAEPHYMVLEYYDRVRAHPCVDTLKTVQTRFSSSHVCRLFPSQGDLKQYLRISKSKDDKVKSQPLSTKTKVSLTSGTNKKSPTFQFLPYPPASLRSSWGKKHVGFTSL